MAGQTEETASSSTSSTTTKTDKLKQAIFSIVAGAVANGATANATMSVIKAGECPSPSLDPKLEALLTPRSHEICRFPGHSAQEHRRTRQLDALRLGQSVQGYEQSVYVRGTWRDDGISER